MITIEDVLPTLHELFIEKLPLYIEEINKEKNDGLLLLPFENKTLFENCQKLPCFMLEQKNAEYTEKDRIIENTVIEFKIEIKTKNNTANTVIETARYIQAIDKMLKEYENGFQKITITKTENNVIYLKITL